LSQNLDAITENFSLSFNLSQKKTGAMAVRD